MPRHLDGSDAVLSLFSCEQDVRTNDKGDNILAVKQGQKPQAASLDVPADDNKTAWLTLLACLSPGSKLMINNAGITQMNSAFLKVLLANGANIELHNVNEDQPLTLSEGKIKVGFAAFSGFTIKESEILSVCSELLLLCVAAVYAKGTSRIEGIHNLPYRWEDRVTTFVDALTIIGVPCSLQAGVLEIEGCIPCGGELDSAGDYHLSLAMLALGMRSRSPVTVNDCHKLLEEFEEFETIVESLGFHCQLTQ